MNKKSIKLFVQNYSIALPLYGQSANRLYSLFLIPHSSFLIPHSSFLIPYPLLPLHFNSVEQILTQLSQQPGWEKFREYRQLLKCWNSTVSQTTAEHTRPLYIARQVLWVAASSATRAQELSFQRYTLLKRLNKQLPFTLKDIRFSSSQWHQTQQQKKPIIFNASRQQKSKVDSPDTAPQELGEGQTSLSTPTAKDAARRWLETLKQSSSTLLCCPNCHSHTLKEEIERWNLCHHCVAAKWSKKYRPPTFPEIE